MPKFLVAYDTTEGQTRNIAQRVADAVSGAGHQVELHDIRKLPSGFSVDRFDAAIIGASIHLGKHSKQFAEFIAKHLNDLETIPSAFFSVSLSAAGTEEEGNEATKYVSEFLEQTDWIPPPSIPNALRASEPVHLKTAVDRGPTTSFWKRLTIPHTKTTNTYWIGLEEDLTQRNST